MVQTVDNDGFGDELRVLYVSNMSDMVRLY